MTDELRAGSGRVIRPTHTRALAEIRMMLEVAVAYDKPILWTSLGLLAQQHSRALLSALPTETDPSDREGQAYVAGQAEAREATLWDLDHFAARYRGLVPAPLTVEALDLWVEEARRG